MHERYPTLESDIEDALISLVMNEAERKSGILPQIETSKIQEGAKTAIIRAEGGKEVTETVTFSADCEIPRETILYGSAQDLINAFMPIGDSMASEKSKHLFNVVNEAVSRIGNVVEGKGQPLSFELILQTLENIEINFEKNGDPIMPTMVVGKEAASRLEELQDTEEAAEFEKLKEELIIKKRREWRAREANRKLVG